ncbi:dickkopf-related protein 3a isoform X1 [Gadus macrocephalus]|uniref:dickkopf-related protein 3a isoform X1 n=1 Tax=Gadus macrocephalus TaxID=80720 RepID=UPI0028CBA050|nr:dickkopf-related protein 3a isoform X1 [Gadus macrocephalus]
MALGLALRTSSDSTNTTGTTTPSLLRCSSGMMLRLLALGFLGVIITPVVCILPEIQNNGIHHILDYNSYHVDVETSMDNNVVETVTEHPAENKREEFEDASNQVNQGDQKIQSNVYNETGSEKVVVGNHSVQIFDKILDNNIPTGDTEEDFNSQVVRANGKECIIAEDCERGRYCFYDTQNSKCLPCKALDVPCTKDAECCDGHMCVWGQCSPNATKGEAGRICHYQGDCNEDLCCAVHKALLFPVCSAKPIERERCLGPSNHLTERMSIDGKGEGPLEHCPCVGDLHCQPLGRGSLCLQGPKSSEEDLADTLYSEIDYIV